LGYDNVADVEYSTEDPICSILPNENNRLMYVPVGSKVSTEHDEFKAICFAGTDDENINN